MRKRKINEKDVENVVENPVLLKGARNNTLQATGIWGDKFLNIIFIKQNDHVVIITVYPSEKVII